MKIIEWLSDEMTRQLILPPMVAGLGVVLLCAVLSVLVVVKRMAFVGQGVAHSAFGGIGLASVISVLLSAPAWAGHGSVFELVVVVAFCVLTALGMASVAERRGGAVQVDTGIGLFLVASMALGALLVEAARQIASAKGIPAATQPWESLLFGSILNASWSDALAALSIGSLVLLTLFLLRRGMLFYVTDESAAEAFGLPVKLYRTALMVLLAIATVVAMRLTGVVLSSALLVLPGAAALKLSRRLGVVMLLACLLGVLGVLLGLTLSVQFNVQAGPCVVLVLTAFFGLSLLKPARIASAAPTALAASTAAGESQAIAPR